MFEQSTAPQLSGFFDTEVWTRYILQVCNQEPFACHAVIAIGALNLAMGTCQIKQNHAEPDSMFLLLKAKIKYGEPHYSFAVRQYGKALTLMRGLSQKTHDSFQNILLSVLLTTCFENFIGNQNSALIQAQVGLKILTDKEKSLSRVRKIDSSYYLRTLSTEENELFSTFARLETMSILFQDKCHQKPRQDPHHLATGESTPFRDFPAVFRTIREARFCWDVVLKRAWEWRNSYLQHHNSRLSNLDSGEYDIPDANRNDDKSAKQLPLKAELFTFSKEQWLRAFTPLFDKARKDKGNKAFEGTSILMIQ